MITSVGQLGGCLPLCVLHDQDKVLTRNHETFLRLSMQNKSKYNPETNAPYHLAETKKNEPTVTVATQSCN